MKKLIQSHPPGTGCDVRWRWARGLSQRSSSHQKVASKRIACMTLEKTTGHATNGFSSAAVEVSVTRGINGKSKPARLKCKSGPSGPSRQDANNARANLDLAFASHASLTLASPGPPGHRRAQLQTSMDCESAHQRLSCYADHSAGSILIRAKSTIASTGAVLGLFLLCILRRMCCAADTGLGQGWLPTTQYFITPY